MNFRYLGTLFGSQCNKRINIQHVNPPLYPFSPAKSFLKISIISYLLFLILCNLHLRMDKETHRMAQCNCYCLRNDLYIVKYTSTEI